MKRNTIRLSVAIVLVALTAHAADPPPVEWTRTFIGAGDVDANWLEQTEDGGFIIAGWTTADLSGPSDFYLVKTDRMGNLVWQRQWGPAAEQDAVRSVHQTSDGGYLVAGFTQPSGVHQPYIARTDSLGEVLWERTLVCGSFGQAFAIQETQDGGYVVSVLYGGFGDSAGVHIFKGDSLGNTQWRTVLRNGGLIDATGIPVLQTLDGGYLVGAPKRAGLDMELWLVRLSSGGDSLWARTYPAQSLGGAVSVCQTSDGGYIITGGGGMDDDPDDPSAIFLAKTNSNGVLQWKKTYGGPDMDVAFSVQQTTDGGFVLAGESVRPDSNYNAIVIKTSSTGVVSWTISWGYSSICGTGATGIRQTPDGGYVITGAGFADAPPEAGGFIFLVKLAPEYKRR